VQTSALWQNTITSTQSVVRVAQRVAQRVAPLVPGRWELHAEPHVRPISCHVASLSWQEPEEELNKLLLMKVSDRDRNIKVKNVGCVEVMVSFVVINNRRICFIALRLTVMSQ